jgi:hypothetical protein
MTLPNNEFGSTVAAAEALGAAADCAAADWDAGAFVPVHALKMTTTAASAVSRRYLCMLSSTRLAVLGSRDGGAERV